ncbi:cleavage polyadenylation factor subunit CFT2 [Sporobolomyces koalae]|uniref:cleavage polyadenylation factor subunit CFT2 n=1 Tax=Sporobolomyces koalae TaxID=500713 RepID=UPI003172AD77
MSISLTPLSGPFPAPPAYLLTVDNAQILLDCGVYDRSPESSLPRASTDIPTDEQVTAYLSQLRQLAPHLSLVLLSHPLLTSLGLLPWLRARCGLRCPVYATLPTREMGRYAVEEWVEARTAAERNEARQTERTKKSDASKHKSKKGKNEQPQELVVQAGQDVLRMKEHEVEPQPSTEPVTEGQRDRDPWDQVWKLTSQEIREAFLAINAVRWTQPVHLNGPLKGYTLVAHRSGHTLGGSLYTLRPSLSSSLSPASSASSLLYAPLFNHIKEHHLDPTSLLSGGNVDDNMRRMGVVVVGAQRSRSVNIKRIDRERKLLDLITTTLDSSGSILLPTDPSARLFELLVLLESHWSFSNLGSRYPLCLLSRTGKDAVGFVRSLTEWMGGQVSGEKGSSILKFSNLKIFTSIEELTAAIPASTPKLVLTVPSTLSYGYARTLFVDYARQPNNLIILTEKCHRGSLSRWLVEEVWERGQEQEGTRYGQGKVGKEVQMDNTIELDMHRKVFLEGEELEAHLEAERQAADLLAKQQAALERSRRMMHTAGDGSDSDSDASGPEDEEEEEAGVAAEEMVGEQPVVPIRRRTGGFTGGAGAWDEFLDEDALAGQARGQSFDIYVKGEYGVRKLHESNNLPRFRMFPVVERKRRVDAYGEAIDVEGWLRRGVDEDPLSQGARQVLGKRTRQEEEEAKAAAAEEEKPEAPHKYVVDKVELHLQSLLFVVDMEGLSDGRALKTILPQINPRKLVIVDGSQAAIEDLASACRSVTSMTQDIYTPALGEKVTIGEETKNFSIRLGDSIMASLRLSRVEDYDVAYVSGVVHIDPESDLPVLERGSFVKTHDNSSTSQLALGAPEPEPTSSENPSTTIETDPVTAATAANEDVPVQATEEETINGEDRDELLLPALRPSLFIGDLRLALLKERLSTLQVPTEFTGEGVLVCGPAPPESFEYDFNTKAIEKGIDLKRGTKAIREELFEEAMQESGGKVAVRKVGRGKLVIDGQPGETYFVVRKAIYALHAQAG